MACPESFVALAPTSIRALRRDRFALKDETRNEACSCTTHRFQPLDRSPSIEPFEEAAAVEPIRNALHVEAPVRVAQVVALQRREGRDDLNVLKAPGIDQKLAVDLSDDRVLWIDYHQNHALLPACSARHGAEELREDRAGGPPDAVVARLVIREPLASVEHQGILARLVAGQQQLEAIS